nr:hypothetical protein [uncultured bacterium]
MNPSPRRSTALVCILFGVLAAAPAQARQASPRTAPTRQQAADPAPAPAPADAMVPLAEHPYDAPALGISIYLPEDSVVTAQAISVGTGRLQVQPRGKEWLLQVYNQRSTNKNLTLTEVLDSIIKQRQNAEAKAQGEFGKIIDPKTRKPVVSQPFERTESLTVNGVEAARVYMGFRHLQGRAARDLTTTGYTVFRSGPGEFLIAQIDTPDTEFERSRRVYETILATVTFRDMSAIQADRAAAILTGTQLLSSVTADDLESLLDADGPLFFRIYEPSPTQAAQDDTEVAWQRVEVRKGQLGELSLRKKPVDWSPTEREFGFLATVTGAYVSIDGDEIRMEARYFLSFDRERETWFVQNLVHQAAGPDRKTPQDLNVEQTVVRQGKRLTVSVVQSSGAPRVTEFDLPEDGYISKVELMLLPRIVAARNLSGIFGFYAYDSRLDQVVLRRDIFDRTELGNWSVRSRDAENARESLAKYDNTGRLLTQALPEGRVVEPIDPQRLLRLWRDKGLAK